MRSRVAWVVGGLGVAAAVVVRGLRGQSSTAPVAEPVAPTVTTPPSPPPPEPPPAPPAPVEEQPDERVEALRRKLEEARAVVDERDEFESGETTVDEAEAPPAESPDDRRKHVHERARSSVDRMKRSADDR